LGERLEVAAVQGATSSSFQIGALSIH
jgi:hypothetical protein